MAKTDALRKLIWNYPDVKLAKKAEAELDALEKAISLYRAVLHVKKANISEENDLLKWLSDSLAENLLLKNKLEREK